MQATRPKHSCFYGQTGSGKSTLLAASWYACPLPAIVVDPLGEHSPRPIDEHIKEPLDVAAAVADACRRAYDRGNCQVVVDESDLAWHGSTPPFEVIFLARRGRHRNAILLLATQRPIAIPTDIRGTAADLYTFQQTDVNDIKYFESCGLDGDALRLTPPRHFWHYRRNVPKWHMHSAPLTVCDVVATQENTP